MVPVDACVIYSGLPVTAGLYLSELSESGNLIVSVLHSLIDFT